MSPLLRKTLEEKAARRRCLMALPYVEKVRIVEQMRAGAVQIKSAVDREAARGGTDWTVASETVLREEPPAYGAETP